MIENGSASGVSGIYAIGNKIAQVYIEQETKITWKAAKVPDKGNRGGGHGHSGE